MACHATRRGKWKTFVIAFSDTVALLQGEERIGFSTRGQGAIVHVFPYNDATVSFFVIVSSFGLRDGFPNTSMFPEKLDSRKHNFLFFPVDTRRFHHIIN